MREKESVHFAFPFRVPAGDVRLDLGWAAIRPGAGQIEGSCRDYFCVQGAVDLSNSRSGVWLVCLDAPLVEMGAMTDESPAVRGYRRWRTEVPSGQTVFSYAMNNYWHTNYKADQEGPAELRYRIVPHGEEPPEALKRVGIEAARPLVVTPPLAAPPRRPALEVSPAAVVVSSLAPSADRAGWIARLFNAGGATEEVRLTVEGSVRRSNPDEERLDPIEGRFPMGPGEVMTVRIDR